MAQGNLVLQGLVSGLILWLTRAAAIVVPLIMPPPVHAAYAALCALIYLPTTPLLRYWAFGLLAMGVASAIASLCSGVVHAG